VLNPTQPNAMIRRPVHASEPTCCPFLEGRARLDPQRFGARWHELLLALRKVELSPGAFVVEHRAVVRNGRFFCFFVTAEAQPRVRRNPRTRNVTSDPMNAEVGARPVLLPQLAVLSAQGFDRGRLDLEVRKVPEL
jgi:hypothetical protein